MSISSLVNTLPITKKNKHTVVTEAPKKYMNFFRASKFTTEGQFRLQLASFLRVKEQLMSWLDVCVFYALFLLIVLGYHLLDFSSFILIFGVWLPDMHVPISSYFHITLQEFGWIRLL